MRKLKVYYPVPNLGPSIRRRQRKMLELAPSFVESVGPEQADIQILSICEASGIKDLAIERYILYLHNAPKLLGDIPPGFEDALGRALAVFSWADYPKAFKAVPSFARLPQGADPEVFKSPKSTRAFIAGTTGFVGTFFGAQKVEGEPIIEVHKAARRLGKEALQIGPRLEGVMHYDGYIEDDAQVARSYSLCEYVSGLRWWGGFECPSLEGLLCGCRPVCFDLPDERYWWGDHAVFVDHDPNTLVEQLTKVFECSPDPVTLAERDYLARKFSWKTLAREFWSLVLASA